jgi:HEAT repeat protein
MVNDEPRIHDLAAWVMQNPGKALSEKIEFNDTLAQLGTQDVYYILNAMRGPVPKGQHSIDVAEALGAVLKEMAKVNSQPLIEVVEQDAVQPELQIHWVVSALGYADSEQAIDTLIKTLKHPDKWVRYRAASALVKIQDDRVVEPLIAALSDRSFDVKFIIVEAMQERPDLRNHRAIKPLKRMAESESIHPGLRDYAKRAIRQIENEQK